MKTILILILIFLCAGCVHYHDKAYEQGSFFCDDFIKSNGEHVGSCLIVAEVAK